MTTQPQASPPKPAMKDPIQLVLGAIWKVLALVLSPLYPIVTVVENLWAGVFNPIYAWIGKTKILDSVQWTLVSGLVVLGILLLIIRILVNV